MRCHTEMFLQSISSRKFFLENTFHVGASTSRPLRLAARLLEQSVEKEVNEEEE